MVLHVFLIPILTCLLFAIDGTFATGSCGCYSFRLLSYKQCVKRSVVNYTSPTFSITPECWLETHGCMNYGALNAANVTLNLQVPNVVGSLVFKVDGCKMLDELPTSMRNPLNALNYDTKCPILTGKTVCASGPQLSLNLALVPNFLHYLDLASRLGVVNGTLKMVHGTNASTCLKFAVETKRTCTTVPSYDAITHPPLLSDAITLPSTTSATTLLSTTSSPTLPPSDASILPSTTLTPTLPSSDATILPSDATTTSTATNFWSSVISNLSSLAANITTSTMTPLPTISFG